MTSKRRIGSATSAARDTIINAAALVLQESGAGTLTASSVAKKAGVKAHMVHYYFRSMEDLVVALVRQHGSAGLKNTARAIASDKPIRALWDAEFDYKWSLVAMEFTTFAARHDEVRLELLRYIEDLRNLQAEGIARHYELRGKEPPIQPRALTIMIAAIARQMVREREYGVSLGHGELLAVVEAFLEGLETVRA